MCFNRQLKCGWWNVEEKLKSYVDILSLSVPYVLDNIVYGIPRM